MESRQTLVYDNFTMIKIIQFICKLGSIQILIEYEFSNLFLNKNLCKDVC